MVRLSDKPKKAVLSVHIIFVTVWLGAAACGLILMLAHSDLAEKQALRSLLQTLYFVLFIPAAIGSIKSGIILSLFTHWGLFRYYWIIVKLFVSVSAIVWMTLFIGRWIMADAGSGSDTHFLVIGFSVQLALILFLVIVSVFKPWGKVMKNK